MANTQQMANAIRALAMDAVQQANSGHPGAPMGMADMAVALWGQHLRHNPRNPGWFNRDRFVLSNGHGSMLLYALLHLTGYKLPMSELKDFRQLHSKTAGHPETGITPGVETTTGPLGQGITNAVGMALAEKLLAKEFNRDGHPVVDHHTYVFMGDGCLMEGISHEACALAGAWKLNKLIALYDDNGISIDGQVAPWFIDNTALRFAAYGWNVIGPIDGHDAAVVAQAIADAKNSADKPTLVLCKTRIGQGSPNRAEHRQGARRAAGRRGDQAHARGHRLDACAFRDSERGLCRLGRQGAGPGRGERLESDLRCLQGCPPRAGQRIHTAHEGRPAEEFRPDRRGCRPSPPTARPKPWHRARPRRSRWKPSPPPCPSCWAARPT